MTTTADDVTLGELGRQVDSVRRDLRDVVTKLDALPERLAADLDARSAERIESFRREHDLVHAAHEEKHRTDAVSNAATAASVALLWKIVWGVIAFVFAAVGVAVMGLILVNQGSGK